MDRDQTLLELFDAMADGDAELAREQAAHLKLWLARGGFAPLLQVLVGGDKEFTLPPELASVICTSVIDYSQHRAAFAKPSLPVSSCEDPSAGLY